MQEYDTFQFNFVKIKNFINDLTTEESIDFLKWIKKEYLQAGSPKKEKQIAYKKNPNRFWAYNDEPEMISHEYWIDEFKNKIEVELKFHEDRLKNSQTVIRNFIDTTKTVIINGLKKNKIFISYAHEENDWLLRIKKHIKALQLEGIEIEEWDDTKIKSGENWKVEVEKALSEACIAILLVTTNFLSSDFIINNELPTLLDNANKNKTIIKPLILSPCRFLKIKQLSKYQAINDPEKEILAEMKHPTQERILLRLMDEIAEIIENN